MKSRTAQMLQMLRVPKCWGIIMNIIYLDFRKQNSATYWNRIITVKIQRWKLDVYNKLYKTTFLISWNLSKIKMNLLFISELGEYVHPCEDDLVCVSTIEDVPHFNAPIFLENKQQIGKVDEIFGSIRNFVSSHSQFLIIVYSMCSTK